MGSDLPGKSIFVKFCVLGGKRSYSRASR